MAGLSTKAHNNRLTLPVIIISLVLLTCAFLPAHYFRYPYIFSLIMDALHFPAGFTLFVIIYLTLPKQKYTAHILFILASFIFAAVELLQPFVGRTASWGDLMISLLGVFIAWLWAMGKQYAIKFTSVILFPLVIGGTLWLLKPGIQSSWRAYKIHQLYPVLANFESDAHRLIVPLSRSNVEQKPHDSTDPSKGHYLFYSKRNNRWSGIGLKIIQSNWSKSTELCFEAKGELENTKLRIRFDDQLSSSSQTSHTKTIAIQPQWGRYCVDIQQLTTAKTRTIDITKMKNLIFFIDGYQPPKHFSIDNIRVQ